MTVASPSVATLPKATLGKVKEISMYNEGKHWIIHFLMVIIIFCVALFDTYAQESNLSDEENSSYLTRRWLTLGPFIEGKTAPEAIEVDYLKQATGIPESQFATLEGAPKAGDSVALTLEGYATQERIWKVLELAEEYGDVNRMLVEEGDVDFAVAYLLTFIESKEATERELRIHSDDAVKVWLNGKLLHSSAVDRPLEFVDLKEGINCLMVKVADSEVYWRLTVRFENESGLKFFDTHERQLMPSGKRLIRLPTQLRTKTRGFWKTYRYVDGLAGNQVTTIFQDSERVMWFGTWGSGISRFDGKSWKTYTKEDGLVDNWVHTIIQDEEGAMWFGTEGGVSRFDGRSWKKYTRMDGGEEIRTATQILIRHDQPGQVDSPKHRIMRLVEVS